MWVAGCYEGVGELQMTHVAHDKCLLPKEPAPTPTQPHPTAGTAPIGPGSLGGDPIR